MSPEYSAPQQTSVMWVEHQMGKQRGSCSHRYCLRACYVPGIVLGTADTAQNKTKSLSPWSQNSEGQLCTLWAFSHFVVPFQLHYDPGPSVCSLPRRTPINSSQGKKKEHCLPQALTPAKHCILSGCLPSQEQRLEETSCASSQDVRAQDTILA